MTKVKKPSVKKLIGSVSIIKIGFSNIFSTARTKLAPSATHIDATWKL
ncbi:hypothetical protein BTTAP_90071 [Brochothrix thermosphacta]|nr:hypothetical protein BTTAP_90071 [Brochothrix thermosphacta]